MWELYEVNVWVTIVILPCWFAISCSILLVSTLLQYHSPGLPIVSGILCLTGLISWYIYINGVPRWLKWTQISTDTLDYEIL